MNKVPHTYNRELIFEIKDKNPDFTPKQVAKLYCKEIKIEYRETVRKGVNKILNRALGKSSEVTSLSALKPDGTIMTIEEYCEFYQIPFSEVKTYTRVTHSGKGAYYNIRSKDLSIQGKDPWDISDQQIEKTVKSVFSHFKKVEDKSKISTNDSVKNLISSANKFGILPLCGKNEEAKALRIIITDLHIGLDVGCGGNSLYDGKYDAEEIEKRRQIILDKVKEKASNRTFEEIHLLDLGDLVDGWNQGTTRGGHNLPQNMDNEGQFDNAVEFKVKLISDIYKFFPNSKIKVFSICNDNHAGSFAYIVNSAIEKVGKVMFSERVEINTLRRFISHYEYGNHNFILSHGKDSTHQKYGFPIKLDDKARSKIEEYMKRHNLYNKDRFTLFEKGDSHIQLFDDAGSNDFTYNSYIAFCPPSQWAQHNFTGSKSGFNLMIVDKYKNEKETTTYYF